MIMNIHNDKSKRRLCLWFYIVNCFLFVLFLITKAQREKTNKRHNYGLDGAILVNAEEVPGLLFILSEFA